MEKQQNNKKTPPVRTKQPGDKTTITGAPADIIILNPPDSGLDPSVRTEEHIENTIELLKERVVSYMQRRARGRQLRRRSPRLAIRRKILRTKVANKQQLQRRAMRMAKQMLRRKYGGARGAKYQSLSPTEKIKIDKMIEPRSKMIKKIAQRIMMRVRAGELKRVRAVQTGKSTKGVYGMQQIIAGDEPKLIWKLSHQSVTKADLDTLFEAYSKWMLQHNPILKQTQTTANTVTGNTTIVTTKSGKRPAIAPVTKAEKKEGKPVVIKPVSKLRSALTYPIRTIAKTGLAVTGAALAAKSFVDRPIPTTALAVTAALSKLSRVGKPEDKKRGLKEYLLTRKTNNALVEKAQRTGIPYEIIREVFDRGIEHWNNTGMGQTAYQVGMARVNSYIAKGATYYDEDADLRENSNIDKLLQMRKLAKQGALNFNNLTDEQRKTLKQAIKKVHVQQGGILPKRAKQIIRRYGLDEEGGAGDIGTDKLIMKYKKDTPGQHDELGHELLDGNRSSRIRQQHKLKVIDNT